MGLIVFGITFIVIALVARFTISWEVNKDSKCIDNEIKRVRENKINFYFILTVGCILIICGIIYNILSV